MTRSLLLIALCLALAAACSTDSKPNTATSPAPAANVQQSIATSSSSPTTLPPPVPLDTSCEASAFTTFDMEACAAKERDQLDVAMDQLLDEIRSAVGPSHVADVNAAQAAWSDYLDKECFVSGLAAVGGREQGVITDSCLVTLTETRIRELQDDLVSLGPHQ